MRSWGPEVKPTMHMESIRVRCAGPWTLSARGLRSLPSWLLLAAPAFAQGTRVAVSTTDDVLAGPAVPFAVNDGDLVSAGDALGVRPHFCETHFQASCGFVPGDIDAFARRPGSTPGRADSIVFSLLSNEGGFLDGDLIGVSPNGGAVLLVSELQLATALGDPAAAIDVDALAYDDQGRVLFSLQTDQASVGVLDGDILRLELGMTSVTKVLSESDVQQRFTQATSLADAILDVQGLEFEGGEIWVAVQSPSSQDGAVIQVTGTPHVVLDENAMGLGGAEIDALALVRPGDEVSSLRSSIAEGLPGDAVHFEVYGEPHARLMVLMAGNTGVVDFTRWPGFGSWFVDRFDPWMRAVIATHQVSFAQLDGNGRLSADWNTPTGSESGVGFGSELGWTLQMLDVSDFQLSAPLRLRRL